MNRAVNWIAVDWGTTHLRAWHMSPTGESLAQASSDKGMSKLSPEQFEPALLDLVGTWLESGCRTCVAACGMVGARQGWVEAPYAQVPCRPGGNWISAPARDECLEIRIAGGVQQGLPPDVMRGEETQVAGLLFEEPDFEGLLCLPGTHSKWVRVSEGKILTFQTFMTGELFELLARKSVLRHTLADGELDMGFFSKAVREALASPESVVARLFSLRAEALLAHKSATVGFSQLSGWLIGQELAAARAQWRGAEVVVAGAGPLAETYAAAMEVADVSVALRDAESLTIAGLSALLD